MNDTKPEFSDWKCYMFGSKPGIDSGFAWNPFKEEVPNFFIRWMMKICFACTWIKE